MTASAIDRALLAARARLERVEPEALAELGDRVLVVDIRPEADRTREGVIPGSVPLERNVLEWRLDPTSLHRLEHPQLRADAVVVIVCNEGYASSLAAASLQDLGLSRATDLVGGHRGWAAAGLPVQR